MNLGDETTKCCGSCNFFEEGFCKANPPTPVVERTFNGGIVASKNKAVWPAPDAGEVCACWMPRTDTETILVEMPSSFAISLGSAISVKADWSKGKKGLDGAEAEFNMYDMRRLARCIYDAFGFDTSKLQD